MSVNPTADLKKDRKQGKGSIGRGTYWNGEHLYLTVYTDQESIIIGRYCSIGPRVTISAGGQHKMDCASTWPFDHFYRGIPNGGRGNCPPEHTEIGSDVWIGYQAYIGGGVKVGHGAVIGANTVVTKDVPPYAVVVGNPARIVRYRFDEPIIEALLQIAWWNWTPEQIEARVDSFYLPIEEFVAMYLPLVGSPAPPAPPLLPTGNPTIKMEMKVDVSKWKPTW